MADGHPCKALVKAEGASAATAADADTDDEAAPIAVPEPLAVPHEEIRKSIFIKGLVEDIRNLFWQKLDPADSFDIMIKKGADIERLIDRRKAIDGKDDVRFGFGLGRFGGENQRIHE